jgi:ParB family transcriptional regulator, chromosome partitioning protein
VARKDVLLGITQAETTKPERTATPGYAARGASRSMLNSISELAAQAAKAERLLEGETVVDLDTSLIDGSFVSDRMGDNDEAFEELVEAIRERGQDSPILVRPHPRADGRYQIVFGHRRVRVAERLGLAVRAVVKPLEDRDHIIAQGQENSARENLSFIERAVFAQKLIDLGHDRETVQSALSIDAPMLTRMLSVTKRVPDTIIQSIGAAKGIGRDRWLEMTMLIERPSTLVHAIAFIKTKEFESANAGDRFNLLFNFLKTPGKGRKTARSEPRVKSWAPQDNSVSAISKIAGKSYTLALKDKDGTVFGGWISDNLERFYREFRKSEKLGKAGE